MAQIDGELRRLTEVAQDSRAQFSADLVAEEIAARLRVGQGYVWNEDIVGADIELASGLRLRICGDDPRSLVSLAVHWAAGGTEPRKQVGRWLPEATQAASSYLRAGGWRIEDSSRQGQTIHLSAVAPYQKLLEDLDSAAGVVDKVGYKLSFQ